MLPVANISYGNHFVLPLKENDRCLPDTKTYYSSMSGLLFRPYRFLSKNQIGELPSTIFVKLTKLEAL